MAWQQVKPEQQLLNAWGSGCKFLNSVSPQASIVLRARGGCLEGFATDDYWQLYFPDEAAASQPNKTTEWSISELPLFLF